MATASKHAMRGLLSRLQDVGIPPTFARNVLPEWWDDNIAQSPAGLQQAQAHFARVFNIDFKSLASSERNIQFKGAERKFKLNRNVAEAEVEISANFAAAVAKLALATVSRESVVPPNDPVALRRDCLASTEGPLTLISLLSWCKSAQIPVVHIDKLPGKKMTGMVVKESGRYAVVLSKKGHPSILLFHLAHELGHIAKHHLKEDGFVADEEISLTAPKDADEIEADAYAVALINGRNVAYSAGRALPNALSLFKAAQAKGLASLVDPGHIILNYAHNQRAFPLAHAALRYLPGPSDGAAVVNHAFFAGLDVSCWSDDQQHLIQKFTGHDIDA